MSMNKIFVASPIIDKEMISEAVRVLNEEKLVMGESVYKFEEEFANYINVDHAISCSSGTNALQFINRFLELKGNVITTPSSYIATSNSLVIEGVQPNFVDIDLNSGNIDHTQIDVSVNDKTSAILPVHLHGNPVEFDEILETSKKYDLPIIEDAAQAHGAEYKGKKIGSLGHAAAFSFYSTKNMTGGGDGGMVTTNDSKLASLISKARDGGRVVGNRYLHDTIGYTSRLNTISAAILRVQLKYIDKWNQRRNQIADYYQNQLKSIEELHIPKIMMHSKSVYHLFPVLIDRRDDFVEFMENRNIQIGVNYPICIPEQPFYKNNNLNLGNWGNAKIWSKKVINLPIHVALGDQELKYIVETITEYYSN